MLGKVFLYLEKNRMRAAGPLVDDLREHGIAVASVSYTRSDEKLQYVEGYEAAHGTAESDEDSENAEKRTDALYITDSGEAYRALCKQGGHVLPYRHEENGDADFAGALYVIERIEELGYEEIDMAYRRLAGLPWEIITTKRCIIRETTEEDADSFYRIYAEPEITAYMEDLYADREAELAYIREYREKVYGFYGYGMWTVLTKDGTVIGRAGISWREGYAMPELGFVIGVPWQRQGYAYEVCSAILGYAAAELGLTQVQALVMTGNERSSALCRKLGFRFREKAVIEGKEYARMVWHG